MKTCTSCKYLDFYIEPISKKVEGVNCLKCNYEHVERMEKCEDYKYLFDEREVCQWK